MSKHQSSHCRNESTDPLESGCGSPVVRGAHFGNRWYLAPNLWGNGSAVLIKLSMHFLTDKFGSSVSGVAETPLLRVMWRFLTGQSVF